MIFRNDMQYVKTYTNFMMQFQAILPFGLGTIPDEYANGSNEEQTFIQNPALFFTVFFKNLIRASPMVDTKQVLVLCDGETGKKKTVPVSCRTVSMQEPRTKGDVWVH